MIKSGIYLKEVESMKIISRALYVLPLCALLLLSSCGRQDSEEPEIIKGNGYSVYTAQEMNSLFDRRGIKKDWLSADGIYSIPVNGDYSMRTESNKEEDILFIFSDTIRGTAKKNGDIKRGWRMPNHSAGILHSGQIDFVFGNNDSGNLFYDDEWLFDGYSDGKNIYIFSFGHDKNWKPEYVRLITVPVKDGKILWDEYTKTEELEKLNYITPDGDFQYVLGAGIMPSDDGYIYIYGYKDDIKNGSVKSLIASRVKTEEFPSFNKLEYRSVNGWSDKIEECADLLHGISCETRVMRLKDGRYLTVYSGNTMSGELMYSFADTPWGPFSTPVTFYHCPESGVKQKNGKGTYYTYNAKVHPVLSKDGRILVSYNVNVMGADANHTDDYHSPFSFS